MSLQWLLHGAASVAPRAAQATQPLKHLVIAMPDGHHLGNRGGLVELPLGRQPDKGLKGINDVPTHGVQLLHVA
eukprot:345779-Alexandrium_andersonii.AAC.1